MELSQCDAIPQRPVPVAQAARNEFFSGSAGIPPASSGDQDGRAPSISLCTYSTDGKPLIVLARYLRYKVS